MSTDNFAKQLTRLLWLAVIATFVAIGIYIVTLGSRRLSYDPAVWGQLGDYLAGTLGTFFSFLAFLGIVLTIALQARQLADTRKHLRLEEMQRLIGRISDTVDGLLQKQPLASSPPGGRTTLALMLIGTSNAIDQQKFAEAIEGWLTEMEHERGLLVIELDQLVWSLEHYRSEGGADFLVSYYRRRYRALAYWIENCGTLIRDRAQRFFDVDEVRRQMRS